MSAAHDIVHVDGEPTPIVRFRPGRVIGITYTPLVQGRAVLGETLFGPPRLRDVLVSILRRIDRNPRDVFAEPTDDGCALIGERGPGGAAQFLAVVHSGLTAEEINAGLVRLRAEWGPGDRVWA